MRAICGILGAGKNEAAIATMAKALRQAGFGEMEIHTSGMFIWAGALHTTDGCLPSELRETGNTQMPVAADSRLDGREQLLASLDDSALSLDHPDEALIAAAYRKWGESCTDHLIGDYAFVLFDPARGTLFCARDHAGARPLFYAFHRSSFVFASDVNAILALPGFDAALDEPAVASALTSRRYRPFARTFFREIRKLPLAHSATVRNGRARLRRYWYPGKGGRVRLPDDRDYAARLRELVSEAVADRLRGGQRYGIHLSGGLDSSAVAAIAVPKLRDSGRPDPIGYSWHRLDPLADRDSEPAWSEAIRAQLDLQLIAPLPRSDLIVDLLRRDWTRNPGPGNLMNEGPVQIDAARRGIEVILSGWGGDQAASFEGRGYHAGLLASGRWPRLIRELGVRGFRKRARRILGLSLELIRQYFGRDDTHAPSLAAPEFLRKTMLEKAPVVRKTSARRVMFDLYANGAITDRLEDWALSGGRIGIDYRYPLLDRRILDFCYGIPDHLFWRGDVQRWLMREAMADLLPPVVANHATKFEPVRTEALAPELIEAFARLLPEVERRRDHFERARFVDIETLIERLRGPWEGSKGQAPVRLALQFLDLDVAVEHRP